MARKKGATKSNEPDQGWRGRHKRNELKFESNNVKISHPMDMSSTISTGDNRIVYDTNSPSNATTCKTTSPPKPLSPSAGSSTSNNASCVKYRHKKFKRVALATVSDELDNKIGRTNDGTSSKQFLVAQANESLTTSKLHITQHGSDGSDASRRTSPKSAPLRCSTCKKMMDLRNGPHVCESCGNVPKKLRNRNDGSVGVTKACDSGADTICDEMCHDIVDEVQLISRVIIANKMPQRNKGGRNSRTDSIEYAVYDERNSAAIIGLQNYEKLADSSNRLHSVEYPAGIVLGGDNASKTIGHLQRSHLTAELYNERAGRIGPQLDDENMDLDISGRTSPLKDHCISDSFASARAGNKMALELSEHQLKTLSNMATLSTMSTISTVTAYHHSDLSPTISSKSRPYKPKFHKAALYNCNSNNNVASPLIGSYALNANTSEKRKLLPDDNVENGCPPFQLQQPLLGPNLEYLKQHISKIISQNEAIVEGVEPALQKKYHKITGIPRGIAANSTNDTAAAVTTTTTATTTMVTASAMQISIHNGTMEDVTNPKNITRFEHTVHDRSSSNKAIPTLQQQAKQVLRRSIPATSTDNSPLNLTADSKDIAQKRLSAIDSMALPSTSSCVDAPPQPPTTFYENHHPQNPERSIIKSLLLNSRGLAVPTTVEGGDAVFTCPLCKTTFRSADDLQCHTKSYCQGTPQTSVQNSVNGSPHSAPISPVGSPSHKYHRSNSFNMYLPEKYSPNTLAKLACSTLRHHLTSVTFSRLAAYHAAGIPLPKMPIPTPITVCTSISGIVSDTLSSSLAGPSSSTTESQSVSSQCVQITKQLIDASLPSPGPLLGKTPLVDHYNGDANKPKENDAKSSDHLLSMNNKNKIHPELEAKHSKHLQMCGGEVKIVDKKEDSVLRFLSSGGSIVSISSSSDSEPSPVSMRTGLLSGGSIIEPKSTKRLSDSTSMPHPISNMMGTYFPFPPAINSITAFNPLTLPAKQPEFGDQTIELSATPPSKSLLGGKMIPYVCGIPGPMPMASIAPKSPLSMDYAKLMPPFDIEATNMFKYQHPIQPTTFNVITPNRVPNEFARKVSQTLPIFDMDKDAMSTKLNYTEAGIIRTIDHNSPALTIQQPPPLIALTTPSFNEKPFNFTRIGDNLLPTDNLSDSGKCTEKDSNCDKDVEMKSVARLQVSDSIAMHDVKNEVSPEPTARNLVVRVKTPEPAIQNSIQNMDVDCDEPQAKPPKFVRPTSLPLKPGTFTPKRHHGITPTANTLPLISPETPRPSKHCVQLYLNGHAYTYLGLKCSTKTFYCTVNRPQPAHFTNEPKSSSYSNWQICKNGSQESLSLYDSRQSQDQRHGKYTIAGRCKYTTLHSQSLICAAEKQADSRVTASTDSLSVEPNKEADVSDLIPLVVPRDFAISSSSPRNGDMTAGCLNCLLDSKETPVKKRASGGRIFSCAKCRNRHDAIGNNVRSTDAAIGSRLFSTDDDSSTDNASNSRSSLSRNTSTKSDDYTTDSDNYSECGKAEINKPDEDETSRQLPDHEAARCLLSLSQQHTLDENMQSMNLLIPCQPIIHPYVKSASTTAQSNETNFMTDDGIFKPLTIDAIDAHQKSVISKCSDPIDLSRPRKSKNTNDASFSGTAGLLKTIMSLTDKVPLPVPELGATNYNIQNPNLLQSYLTERALQKSKMKLSQMAHNVNNEKAANGKLLRCDSITVQASSFDDIWRPDIADRPPINFNRKRSEKSECKPIENGSNIEIVVTMDDDTRPARDLTPKSPSHQSPIEKQNSEPTDSEIKSPPKQIGEESVPRVDRLANILANSPKLNASKVSESQQPAAASVVVPIFNVPSQPANAKPTVNVITTTVAEPTAPIKDKNAKNIVSEYLKIANEKDSKALPTALLDESSSSSETDQVESKPARQVSHGRVGCAQDVVMSAQTVVVGKDGFQRKTSSTNELHAFPLNRPVNNDGPCTCKHCGQTFQKQSQLSLHMKIHYYVMNPGKHRCNTCATTFNSRNLLQKHSCTECRDLPSQNPRPFECTYCERAFRIQGHLAKHLRSKGHVQKLESDKKLPFGTYNKIDEQIIRAADIDTTDCESSLASLRMLAEQAQAQADADSDSREKRKSPESGDGHHSPKKPRLMMTIGFDA